MDEKEFQKFVKKVDLAAKAYSAAVADMQKATIEKAKLQGNIQTLISQVAKNPDAIDKFTKSQSKLAQIEKKIALLTQKQQKLHSEFDKAGKELAQAGNALQKTKKGKK